jgi:hypothetical protein
MIRSTKEIAVSLAQILTAQKLIYIHKIMFA